MSDHLLSEHAGYVRDSRRNDAFRRAFREILRGGEVVLDLGCGTGILGLLALECGAGRVIAVDRSVMLDVARRVAEENGVADRIRHVRAESTDLILDEQVDVVVSDQLDPMGWEAGLLEAYADARRRLLKPGGALVPGALEIVVAGVESPRIYEDVALWSSKPSGLSMASVSRYALNTKYWVKLSSAEVLTTASPSRRLELDGDLGPYLDLRAGLTAARHGTLHGLGCWFRAQLSPGVAITNSPLDGDAVDRGHAFFPLDAPVEMAAGDRVTARLRIRPNDGFVHWEVVVFRGDDLQPHATSSHSTLGGRIGEIQALADVATPQLNLAAKRERAVLDSIGRGGTLAEIETRLAVRSELFPSRDAAARLLGEMIERLKLC